MGTKATPKKMRGFLALPGEVRNMIYEYYFQPEFRCEFAAKGSRFKQPEARTVKLWSGLVHSDTKTYKNDKKVENEQPITIRISRPLGKYNIVKGLQTNWLASLYALNLVCKQVYIETVAFLYCKTVFFFDAPKRINGFLGVVSKPRLENTTKLQLHYNTYGAPQDSRDQIWQDKHNRSWMRACKAASKKLVGLRELEMWVQVHDCAPRFNLREKWVAPLLQFRRLTRALKLVDGHLGSAPSRPYYQRLEIVNIRIRTRWSKSPLHAFNGNRELAKASTNLHLLFGQAISLAILGAKEEEAMSKFNAAWEGEYREWRFHLQFAKTGW